MLSPRRNTLLNLYLNGIQAMGGGGILSVRCMPGPEGLILVEVADTGQGMEADQMKKIFDPYFTTKPTGTGLGLAIVHKIVEAHKGQIAVESSPGKGTVFTIWIPAAPEAWQETEKS